MRDENSTPEGRVLRSGRSTPVCMETVSGKEKAVSQKPVSQRKPKVKKPIKQEGVKELVKREGESDDVKSDLSSVKKEQDSDIEKNVSAPDTKAKAKTKKQPSKVGNQKSKSLAKSGEAQGSKGKKGGKVAKPKTAAKSVKQKVNSDNVTKKKRTQVVKTKGLNTAAKANVPKKTSAIEKLKVRAFDQLKEKLEIAIDRSSISVPECAKLLQQITSPNLSEIFYSQPASVDEGSSDSLVSGLAGKSLPEIMTEGMQRSENTAEKPVTKENTVADNLCKAAHALVSFKIQSVGCNSRFTLDPPSSREFSNSSTQMTQAIAKDHSGTLNEINLTDTGFPDQQFGSIDNQFDGAMSVPNQTVHNLSTTLTQVKPDVEMRPSVKTTVGEQSTSNLVLPMSNLQAVSHGQVSSDSLLKSSITEPSAAVLSSSSPLLAMSNQLLQTASPLVPTTNQFLHMTKSFIPTTSQVLSTVSSLTPTSEAGILTNSLIPTPNQFLQTKTILPTTNALTPITNPLIPTTSQLLSGFPSAIPTSASKMDTTLVAISPVVQAANVLVNQPQLAFQLLQAQGTNTTIPTVMTTTHTQPTPQLICANPTLPCHTTPSQQQATLVTAPLNQRLFLPQITPPIDQKTLGSSLPTILPSIKQPHDLLLPKVVSTATPHVRGTLPTTSANEITSCKLRPILPREPLVSPTFALFNPPLQSLQNVATVTDTSCNVKQAVKRLVNERTKNTDNHSPQQTTALPDIASTFNKGFFTASSQCDVGTMIGPGQNNIEMANKEQAIKALLSIGSGQQTARQGTKGNINVGASKETEPKKPDDLLVVFDTDKGIFKVDDVTIDPQVNTIGKGNTPSSTCVKELANGKKTVS